QRSQEFDRSADGFTSLYSLILNLNWRAVIFYGLRTQFPLHIRMVRSMTGSGSATRLFHSKRGQLEITADIRTVNSRFLDLSLRSPKVYLAFDPKVSQLVRQYLKRGRVDLILSLHLIESAPAQVKVHETQAMELYKTLSGLQTQ